MRSGNDPSDIRAHVTALAAGMVEAGDAAGLVRLVAALADELVRVGAQAPEPPQGA